MTIPWEVGLHETNPGILLFLGCVEVSNEAPE